MIAKVSKKVVRKNVVGEISEKKIRNLSCFRGHNTSDEWGWRPWGQNFGAREVRANATPASR
jgi:hypothetical protein